MKESNSYIRFERTRRVDLEFLTTGTDYLYTAACNLPASGGYLPARGCYLPARGVICLPSINLSNDFHYDFIGLRKTSAQTSPPIIPSTCMSVTLPYASHTPIIVSFPHLPRLSYSSPYNSPSFPTLLPLPFSFILLPMNFFHHPLLPIRISFSPTPF